MNFGSLANLKVLDSARFLAKRENIPFAPWDDEQDMYVDDDGNMAVTDTALVPPVDLYGEVSDPENIPLKETDLVKPVAFYQDEPTKPIDLYGDEPKWTGLRADEPVGPVDLYQDKAVPVDLYQDDSKPIDLYQDEAVPVDLYDY